MKQSAVVSVALFLVTCASRPPPRPPTFPQPTAQAEPARASAPAIRVELVDGPAPWTHLTPDQREDTFQFAIVTDRTGGARKGVFASAVEKLNLLHPEFVVSVGDLIEGYTEDKERILREWDEFDGMVRGLEAPFFYVVGNHDMTNDLMREIWRERYGPSHYFFTYKNVLFVCLNTMDGDLHTVSDTQLTWLKTVLSEHADVAWTLVFLHTPLWDDSLGIKEHSQGYEWERIERALGERHYTAFAGHHHRYVKHERKSHKLFTLATTGGVSGLRGPSYGEFDHVTWVTMSKEGPQIANLFLDGIWDENVRTDELRALQVSALAEGGLLPGVIYYEGSFRRGTSKVRVRNDRDLPFDFTLTAPGDNALTVAPRTLQVSAPPNSLSDQELEVTARFPLQADHATLPVEWTARSLGASGDSLELSGTSTLSLVRLGSIGRTGQAKKLDGRLDDWARLPISVDQPAQVLREEASYSGAKDAHFRLGFAHDAKYLYIAVEAFDDLVRAERETLPWDQDGVEVRIDARPDPVRAHSHGRGDGSNFITVAMSPSPAQDQDWYALEHLKKPDAVEASCVRNKGGFVTEIAIERSALDEAAGGRAKLVRINVAVDDGDPDGQSQLWWWPDWRTPEDIPGSGTLRLSP